MHDADRIARGLYGGERCGHRDRFSTASPKKHEPAQSRRLPRHAAAGLLQHCPVRHNSLHRMLPGEAAGAAGGVQVACFLTQINALEPIGRHLG
jgi:hypothetical protein